MVDGLAALTRGFEQIRIALKLPTLFSLRHQFDYQIGHITDETNYKDYQPGSGVRTDPDFLLY
jgi:hypothetical protein